LATHPWLRCTNRIGPSFQGRRHARRLLRGWPTITPFALGLCLTGGSAVMIDILSTTTIDTELCTEATMLDMFLDCMVSGCFGVRDDKVLTSRHVPPFAPSDEGHSEPCATTQPNLEAYHMMALAKDRKSPGSPTASLLVRWQQVQPASDRARRPRCALQRATF
jgi:hypothetical protein